MSMSKRTRAELFLLLITVVWGSTFVVTKFVLSESSPFLYTAIRFTVATVISAALFFPRLRSMGRDSIFRGAVLGVLLFIGFATQTVGLQYTTPSKSAFITGMMVVFTPICQLFIEKRSPRMGNVIGVVLVLIGLYFLTSPTGSKFNYGDGLTLVCALSFAFYIVALDIFSQDCEAIHLTFTQFVTTAILSVLGFLMFEDYHVHFSQGFVFAVGYLAVFATVIALFVQAKYQKDTTPTRSAIVFSVEPVIAAVFAYFVLAEHIGNEGIAGAVFIMFGIIISEFSDLLFSAPEASQ